MATSEVEIWNLALSAAQARASITDPNASGREADLCRIWYPLVRDVVQKSASWACCNAYASLAVLREREDETPWGATSPAPTWRYAYGAPASILATRYLMSYQRFSLGTWNDHPAVFTNDSAAILYYTRRESLVSNWDAGLTNAIVAGLAWKLAIPLSGKVGLSDRLRTDATESVLLAATELANEYEDGRLEMTPHWISARGFEGPASFPYFVTPFDTLSSLES